MKKTMILTAMAVALCASLVACNNNNNSSTDTETVTSATTSVVSDTENSTTGSESETEAEAETEAETEAKTETETKTETEPETDPKTETEPETETSNTPDSGVTDISKTFASDAASQYMGDCIEDSDLCEYFTWHFGNGQDAIKSDEEGKYYDLGHVNAIYAAVKGKYAITVDATILGGSYATFVRGVHQLTNATGNNVWYYEDTGLGSTDLMGGAGISAFIRDGKLSLVIKTYDETASQLIGYKRLDYDMPNCTEWTIADDGLNTIYILAGDELIYTITLSGSQTYGDAFSIVSPNTEFAVSAVITDKDGHSTTVENTLVAVAPTEVAVADRGAVGCAFRRIEVKKFSDVTIPNS